MKEATVLKKRIWELKQSTQANTLDMYLYGDVEGDGYDWWSGEDIESETSANHFRQELAKYPDAKEINIYINSYGGSVFEGTAIYSQLKRHPAQKTVYIDGFACSVASIIAMAGDKVIMPKNTMMMIHNAWSCAWGNATQLRKAADDLDTIMEGNRQAYLQKSNGKLTEEKLIEMLDAETWLTAEQCVEYGFADEIQENEKDLTQAKQMLQKVNKTLEQNLNYNKYLAASLQEMSKPPKVKEETEPIQQEEETPQDNTDNKVVKMLTAFFS